MQQTKTSSVRAQRWSRIGMATLFISMMLALIIFRLAWLQLFRVHRTLPLDSHSMISQSVIQRERGIVLDDRRGHIVDRKGRIITGEPIQSLVLFPINRADIQEQALNGLSRMLHEDVDIIRQRWLQAKEPILWYTSEDKKQIYALTEAETNYVNSRGWNGVRVLPYVATYPWKEHTPHWVGYTSKVVDNEVQSDLQSQEERTIGAYGLERSFQPLLKSIGASTYVHYTDAAGKPLSGLGVRRS